MANLGINSTFFDGVGNKKAPQTEEGFFVFYAPQDITVSKRRKGHRHYSVR